MIIQYFMILCSRLSLGKIIAHSFILLSLFTKGNNKIMEDLPHTIIELPPNRSLYKKGEFYTSFYYLVSGQLTVMINQNQIRIMDSTILGDYEILEQIDFRVSIIKSVTRCVIKAIDLRYYSKLTFYYRQLEKALEKFSFKSKIMKYWLKKLFEVSHSKRNDCIGLPDSIGIILEGLYKIDRNIPIVSMKVKNLQLLKRFEICLMGAGQIFSGNLICESNKGIVAICKKQYIEQLAKCFEQFSKIIGIATFKGEVHYSMERQIAKNCRKKSKLFSNIVPIPLKNQIKPQQQEEPLKTAKTRREASNQLKEEDHVFQLQNNISQFLHKQWRKGLSLSIRRKDVSPTDNKIKYNSRRKINRSKITCDIKNPIVVTFEKVSGAKRHKSKTKLQLKKGQMLPSIRSIRLKTQGNDKSSIKNNKYLFFS